MSNPEGDRLAELIRDGMKAQPLSAVEMAQRVERLVGAWQARNSPLTAKTAGGEVVLEPSPEQLERFREQAAMTIATADLIQRFAEKTGRPYVEQTISRRLNGSRPMVVVSPDLYVICEILGLDAGQLVAKAIEGEQA